MSRQDEKPMGSYNNDSTYNPVSFNHGTPFLKESMYENSEDSISMSNRTSQPASVKNGNRSHEQDFLQDKKKLGDVSAGHNSSNVKSSTTHNSSGLKAMQRRAMKVSSGNHSHSSNTYNKGTPSLTKTGEHSMQS